MKSGKHEVFKRRKYLKLLNYISNGCLENGFEYTGRQFLWPSGQSSWLQILRPWVRFPALPDFLRSNGSGTGSTQPREYN
jgi:hypothetical protein